jgi:hypothetical protein
MKKIITVAAISFCATTSFAGQLQFSAIELSGSGFDQATKVSVPETVTVQQNDRGFYEVKLIKKNRFGTSIRPIGPVTDFDCKMQGESIVSFDSLVCAKDETSTGGRLDTIVIKRDESTSLYNVVYMWNTPNSTEIIKQGVSIKADSLTLSSVSDGKSTLTLSPNL